MTNPDREELLKLADELDGWHDCADGDVSAGNGHFRVVCESDSEQQRLNLRATLREVSTTLRRLASSDSGVKVKPLVWRDHRPDSFPEPAWSAQTSFGFYNIEEVSASDSPPYVVRLHAHHFVADKDSLDEAKAAAQADYEARIKSALITAPPADAGMREALDALEAEFKGDAIYSPVFPGQKMTRTQKKRDRANLVMNAVFVLRQALTAPGATTKSDGGGEERR